jgi:hypothetical protein
LLFPQKLLDTYTSSTFSKTRYLSFLFQLLFFSIRLICFCNFIILFHNSPSAVVRILPTWFTSVFFPPLSYYHLW